MSASKAVAKRDPAARASIVVLRSTLALAARELQRGVVALLPALRPMTDEDAELYLAELGKPIACIALLAHRRLTLGLWSTVERDPVQLDLLDMSRHELASAHSEGPGTLTDVLVRGAGDEVTLTFREYEQWLADYSFPLASINIRRPSGDEYTRCGLVFTASPPGDGYLSVVGEVEPLNKSATER